MGDKGAVNGWVGDVDLDAVAFGCFVRAVEGFVMNGGEGGAGDFLLIERFGKGFGIDPGSADEFEGEGVADANVNKVELADESGCGGEKGGVTFGNVGACGDPNVSGLFKGHGPLPPVHGDDEEHQPRSFPSY